VLLFRLCTGTFPFQHGTQGELLHRIRHGYIRWRKIPQNLPRRLLDLIRGLLERDPQKRYGAEELRVHPFLTDLLPANSKISIADLFGGCGPLVDPGEHLISRNRNLPPYQDDRQAINSIRQARIQMRSPGGAIVPVLQSKLGNVSMVEAAAMRDLEVCNSLDQLQAVARVLSGKVTDDSLHSESSKGSESEMVGALRPNRPDQSRPSDALRIEYERQRREIATQKASMLRQEREKLPSGVIDTFEGVGSNRSSVPSGNLTEEERRAKEEELIMAVDHAREQEADRAAMAAEQEEAASGTGSAWTARSHSHSNAAVQPNESEDNSMAGGYLDAFIDSLPGHADSSGSADETGVKPSHLLQLLASSGSKAEAMTKHHEAVKTRMELAVRPYRMASTRRGRQTRSEMFASPAGVMSALMSLPSVAEIDERQELNEV